MAAHSSTNSSTSSSDSTSPTSMSVSVSSDEARSTTTTDSTVAAVTSGLGGGGMTWIQYVPQRLGRRVLKRKGPGNATRVRRRRKARKVPTYEGYDSGEDEPRVGSPEPASRGQYELMIISAMAANSASAHFVPRDLPVISPATTHRALKRPRMQDADDEASSSDCSRYDAKTRVVRRKLNHPRKLRISATMSDTSPSSPGPVTPPDSPARFGAVQICLYDEL